MVTSVNAASERYLVEYIDQSTGYITGDAVLCADSALELCKIVDPGAANIKPGCIYNLDSLDLEKIKHGPSITLAMRSGTPGTAARLRTWLTIDDLPYRVHTNRELLLMLEGKKPLAVFSEICPNNTGHELIPERCFDPYVKSGKLFKKECIGVDAAGAKTRTVLYAITSDAWRIEAYLLLLQTAKRSGWSEGFERMEGSLLGYEEWQNDAYIEKIFRQNLTR